MRMSLAEENKKIRKQVKTLRNENLAVSSIYGHLLQFIPEEKKRELSTALQERIFKQFDQKEIENFYGQHSDRIFSSALESYILELIGPKNQTFR